MVERDDLEGLWSRIQEVGWRLLSTLEDYYKQLREAKIDGEVALKLIHALLFARDLEDNDAIPYRMLKESFENYINRQGETNSKKILELFFTSEIQKTLWDYYDTELSDWKDNEFQQILNNSDKVLEVLKKLLGIAREGLYSYGLYSYDFRTIDEDMLGSSYEIFLSLEKNRIRKFEGIFYTPSYISNYLVEKIFQMKIDPIIQEIKVAAVREEYERVRELIEKLKQVRFLEPACGSGSFLVKIYRNLWLRYKDLCNFLESLIPETNMMFENLERKRNIYDLLALLKEGDIYEFYNKICERHIFGIDKDPRAIKLARLNLWKEMLRVDPRVYSLQRLNNRRNNQVFPSLERNLICADTLLDDLRNFPKEFDAVVGNPPYVRWGNLKQDYRDSIKKVYGKLSEGNPDLYVFFMIKAIDLMKKDGLLGFIVSNKWLRAGYATVLRERLLQEGSLVELIDFKHKVFSDASVDTTIVIWQKGLQAQEYLVCEVEEDIQKDNYSYNLEKYIKEKGFLASTSVLSSKSYIVVRKDSYLELSIKEKVEKNGRSLAEQVLAIYRGIVTGLNEAFIIDAITRENLLNTCPTPQEREATAQVIVPIVKGENIKKYCYEQSLYMILTTRNFPIDQYPTLKNYLLQYHDKLRKRAGSVDWYVLQASPGEKKLSLLRKEKIGYSDIGFRFAYIPEDILGDNTVYFIVPISKEDLFYLLSVLNSKLIYFYYYKFLGQTLSGGTTRAFTEYVKKIPVIPKQSTPEEYVELLSTICQNIVSLKTKCLSAQTEKLERQVDHIIYKLYNLEQKEIDFLEKWEP